MNLWKKITIGTVAAAGIVGTSYMSGCGSKEAPKQIPIAVKEPEKKVEDINVPEQVTPIIEPKEQPKPEVPKWEPKPIAYESSVKYENPVTYAIAMEQSRVETTYRKLIGKPVKETELARIYGFSTKSGEDDVVQRTELGTSNLEEKVEVLRKEHNKPYEELNMGSLSISDKTEEKARISIMPENEAQEKRLNALKETYKSPKQAAYVSAMIQLNSADQKISEERLTYVEKKAAEKYGGKK